MEDFELLKILTEANEIKCGDSLEESALIVNHPDQTVSNFLKFLNKIKAVEKFSMNDIMMFYESGGRFSKEAHIAFEKTSRQQVEPGYYSPKEFLKNYPKSE